jgi:hypothetical protein
VHDGLDRDAAGPQQQREVVGDQRPGVTNALGFFQHTPETPKELLPIGIVPENLPPLDPPADDVLQRTRCVDARSSWHVSSHITGHYQDKVIFSAPSPPLSSWAFEKLDTLRHRIIQRAGRFTRPQGQLTLTMSANEAVRKDLMHFLDVLQKAA